MKPYGHKWKRRTLFELELTGSPRVLFCTFLTLADWVGRSQFTLIDLAITSKLHRSTVKRIIPFLVDQGYLKILQHGAGRRPTFYQIIDVHFKKSFGFTMNEPATKTVVGSSEQVSSL